MAQIITPKMAKLGPDNNFTAYIYICMYTYIESFHKFCIHISISMCVWIFLGYMNLFSYLRMCLGVSLCLSFSILCSFWPAHAAHFLVLAQRHAFHNMCCSLHSRSHHHKPKNLSLAHFLYQCLSTTSTWTHLCSSVENSALCATTRRPTYFCFSFVFCHLSHLFG